MSVFKNFGGVSRGYANKYLPDGEYLTRIDEVEFQESVGPKRRPMMKTTVTVLAIGQGPESGQAPRKGEVFSIMFMPPETDGGIEIFLRNVKSQVCDILGATEDEIGHDEITKLVDPDNKEDTLVGAVTLAKVIKKAGKKKNPDGSPRFYSAHSFSLAYSDEEIKAALPEEDIATFFPSGLSC